VVCIVCVLYVGCGCVRLSEFCFDCEVCVCVVCEWLCGCVDVLCMLCLGVCIWVYE